MVRIIYFFGFNISVFDTETTDSVFLGTVLFRPILILVVKLNQSSTTYLSRIVQAPIFPGQIDRKDTLIV